MKMHVLPVVSSTCLLAICAMGIDLRIEQDVSNLPVPQEPDPRPPLLRSRSLATAFLSTMIRPTTESFESLTPGAQPPFTFAFGGGSQTLTLDGAVNVWSLPVSDPRPTINGTFPVEGVNYLVIYPGDSPVNNSVNATITFDTAAVASFGFYATDIELNQLKLILYYPNASPTTHVLPVTTPQGSGGGLYCCVRSPEKPFNKIEFCNVGTAPDGFGFDQMTIATVQETIPGLWAEPRNSDLNPPPPPKTMVLSWPAGHGPSWFLQKCSSLSLQDWVNLTNRIPIITNDVYTVDVECSAENEFFRLMHIP